MVNQAQRYEAVHISEPRQLELGLLEVTLKVELGGHRTHRTRCVTCQ